MLLIVYFVTSTLLSRHRARDKDARTRGILEKAGARDARQVIANGGVFAFAAIAEIARPDAPWEGLGAAALAASAADTWATEIGILAGTSPRSLIGWRPVPVGTSGGVTVQGLLGALAGAMAIAITTQVVGWPAVAGIAALTGGIVGCMLDSLLGATLQGRRWCSSCGAATERRVHHCGRATDRAGGIAWLDNDGVNAASTVGGSLMGAGIARVFGA